MLLNKTIADRFTVEDLALLGGFRVNVMNRNADFSIYCKTVSKK